MESEDWGWILLGIAIGYLLGNRQYEKMKKNEKAQSTLKVPVTRLKNITTNVLSEYDPSENLSTIPYGSRGRYEMIHYDGSGFQVDPVEFNIFNSSSADINLNTSNISQIDINAPTSNDSYSVYIKIKDNDAHIYEGTFHIKVI